MSIGIRKHPHITPTRASLARFACLVRSGKFDLFRCKSHNVLLKVVIE